MQLTTSAVSDYLSAGSNAMPQSIPTGAYCDAEDDAVNNNYSGNLGYAINSRQYPDVKMDVGGGVMGMDRIKIQQQQFGSSGHAKMSPYMRASSFSVTSTERSGMFDTSLNINMNNMNMNTPYGGGITTSETSTNHGNNIHAHNRFNGHLDHGHMHGNGVNNLHNSHVKVSSGIPLGRLTFYEVLDINGIPITLGRLSTVARKNAIFIFVPRHSIEITALVYTKIAHLLHESGTKLIFVLPWLPIQARKFLTRFERISPFPGILVCDPDGTLFQKFGFVRSRLSTLPKIFKNALTQSHNRDLPANSRLRCGVVILKVPGSEDALSSVSSLGSMGVISPNIIYQNVESKCAAISTGLSCRKSTRTTSTDGSIT